MQWYLSSSTIGPQCEGDQDILQNIAYCLDFGWLVTLTGTQLNHINLLVIWIEWKFGLVCYIDIDVILIEWWVTEGPSDALEPSALSPQVTNWPYSSQLLRHPGFGRTRRRSKKQCRAPELEERVCFICSLCRPNLTKVSHNKSSSHNLLSHIYSYIHLLVQHVMTPHPHLPSL